MQCELQRRNSMRSAWRSQRPMQDHQRVGDSDTDDTSFIRTVSQETSYSCRTASVYTHDLLVLVLQEDVVCLACTTGAGVSYKSYLCGYGLASQACSIEREPEPGVSYARCTASSCTIRRCWLFDSLWIMTDCCILRMLVCWMWVFLGTMTIQHRASSPSHPKVLKSLCAGDLFWCTLYFFQSLQFAL